ncbi:MAG: hypothetical protein H6740_15250 [Alphaproteobacteria bacterium]|nr:hypothetical protein [Alphaproteobacteria bacterium]
MRILGVNGIGYESNNAGITEGRAIPWLQDTEQWTVWDRWDVVYRDVIVLGPDNVPVAIYNLTDNDLGSAANYDALRCLLTEAEAQLVTGDGG